MQEHTLILASASPRRSELLRQLQLQFQVVPGQCGEIHSEHLSAGELTQINAYRKARSVSKKFPDAVVIGVDTVVAVGTKIFGKPRTLREACETLVFLQGQTHQVTTGVCLICLRGHRQTVFCEQTEVKFRPLTLDQIRHYHQMVNPLDKAGAYGIQEKGEMLVETISGSFTNVIGLPLERLEVELSGFVAALGAKPPRPVQEKSRQPIQFAPIRPSGL